MPWATSGVVRLRTTTAAMQPDLKRAPSMRASPVPPPAATSSHAEREARKQKGRHRGRPIASLPSRSGAYCGRGVEALLVLAALLARVTLRRGFSGAGLEEPNRSSKIDPLPLLLLPKLGDGLLLATPAKL